MFLIFLVSVLLSLGSAVLWPTTHGRSEYIWLRIAWLDLTGILEYLKSVKMVNKSYKVFVIFHLYGSLKTTKISSDLKGRFFNRWLNSVYWEILSKPFPTTDILSVMLNYNCQTQITFLCNFIAQFIWESAAAALHWPRITKSAGSHHALARCPRRRDGWY